jgi:hypothetical protein
LLGPFTLISSAFLFIPNPNATFDLSEPAPPDADVGVPTPLAGSDTCEKLGRIIVGAGEFEFRESGPGLMLEYSRPGVKLPPSRLESNPSLPFALFFFAFFLSVLPFESVGGSRNSAAWGTAL